MGGGEVLEHLGGLGLLSAEMLEDEGVELRVQWGPWPDPPPEPTAPFLKEVMCWTRSGTCSTSVTAVCQS